MRITFAYNKRAKKPHYQVRHKTIREEEFAEIFSGSMVVIGQERRVLKAVGRTLRGRFTTVAFLQVNNSHYHVITAWPSTRKQIIHWHKEINRQ
jgi:hypothetical protein